MIAKKPFNSPRTFGGKIYKYAGFFSASSLKHERPFYKESGYSIRAIPHPQGSGYNVYIRYEG